MTFGARYIANIIHFAQLQGASKKQLLEIVGVDSLVELDNENLRFDAVIYNAVIEKALELTGDNYLGLHIGNYLSLSAAGLITQIVQVSSTIHEALSHIVTFANLGCQALPFSLHETTENWEVRLTPSLVWKKQSSQSVRHTLDAVMMFTLRELYTLVRQKNRPIAVYLEYPRPERFMEYEKQFNCMVKFSQPYNAIIIDKQLMQQKIITSNYTLLQILVRYAHKQLEEIEQRSNFSSKVRHSILNMIKPQFPTIEQVAKNLNMSVRTLQRKLKGENYTFKKLLEELKQKLALDYLTNPKLTIKEIAYLLDYADSSTFIRTFKRWKGVSPSVYRRQ